MGGSGLCVCVCVCVWGGGGGGRGRLELAPVRQGHLELIIALLFGPFAHPDHRRYVGVEEGKGQEAES